MSRRGPPSARRSRQLPEPATISVRASLDANGGVTMNEDVFAGQWKQMRGELKSWWGKLADDDLDRIGGQKNKLIGLVQEKYGYARVNAEEEVERRFKEFADKTGGVVANM